MTALLRAQDFQRQDDPAIALAEQRESRIARAVRDGLAALAIAIKSVPLTHITIQASVIAAIRAQSVSDALLASYKPIADAFTDAAEMETRTTLGSLVVYDPVYAAGQLAGAQQNFIGFIQSQASQVVRDQLLDAARAGAPAEEVAQALQAVIGLSPKQAQAISNYRRLLERGDRQALARQLRDRRFDASIDRAIREKNPLSGDQIDAMVTRYAERSLASRAASIAHDESLGATTGGIRNAYVQAVQTGRLLASEITRYWQVVFDERLCPICGSIPLLNPEGVGVLQPFISAGGPVMETGVHPNCRCTERYVTDLSRVSSSPFARAA